VRYLSNGTDCGVHATEAGSGQTLGTQ
jgi:hypothetical protein